MTDRILRLAATGVLLLAVAACGGRAADPGYDVSNPKLTEAQARELAAAQLDGFNTCDYATWSASWASSMTAAIKEADFVAFCEGWLGQAGKFVSLDAVSREPAKTAGHVKYVFTTSWERGSALYSIVLPIDGEQITGVNLVPVS
jgi:hypothetical protein